MKLVEILSQAEIEALLASLTSDGESVDPDPASESVPFSRGGGASPSPLTPRSDGRRTIAYEPYDFRRPDKFSKDQLRTLQMLHETFARLFASSLSAYLRVSTHVDLVSVEQVPYNEYMRSLTTSIINVISLEPLEGQAILELEFNVVLAMIDRLLGGPGNMVKNTTVLTEIEKALTESIIQRALKDLRSAWDSVIVLSPKRESMETQSQFIQIVPPNDTIVSILFEVKVGDLRGAMSLCIPYLMLKPITTKLSVQRWFSASMSDSLGENVAKLIQRLERAKVTCVCRLGSARITVNELVQLEVGDTVVLDRKSTEEVDLLIGNSVKFRGKPGTAGRKVALHVNRIAVDECR
jgi:flagellar motor switch protein FliM